MTDSVTPGNRAPREYRGRRLNLGSIGERAVQMLEVVDTLGEVRWVDLRRVHIGGDRGPLYSIRSCLFAAALMYDTGRKDRGSPTYSTPEDLYDRDWGILEHLDKTPPVVLSSATDPGMFQVRCSVCRLTKALHEDKESAYSWFWGKHVREAQVHGLASS